MNPRGMPVVTPAWTLRAKEARGPGRRPRPPAYTMAEVCRLLGVHMRSIVGLMGQCPEGRPQPVHVSTAKHDPNPKYHLHDFKRWAAQHNLNLKEYA